MSPASEHEPMRWTHQWDNVRQIGLPFAHTQWFILGSTEKIVRNKYLRAISTIGFQQVRRRAAFDCFPSKKNLTQRNHAANGCLSHLRWSLKNHEVMLT